MAERDKSHSCGIIFVAIISKMETEKNQVRLCVKGNFISTNFVLDSCYFFDKYLWNFEINYRVKHLPQQIYSKHQLKQGSSLTSLIVLLVKTGKGNLLTNSSILSNCLSLT